MREYDVPLIDPGAIAGFPSEAVERAAAEVRDEAGWHIAPVITETLTLNGRGGRILLVPSLRIVEVLAVRDVTDPASPRVLDGWRVDKSAGLLHRDAGWPQGVASVEVELRHGFAACPLPLYGVLRERCQLAGINPGVRSESLASRSVQFGLVGVVDTGAVMDRYTVRGQI